MIELDELDLRILEQLQNDASISNQELALLVHASPPTCLRRVRRLSEQGVIRRQVALLDPEQLGSSLTAIVEITLDRQGEEYLQQFERLMAPEAAVTQCYRVSTGVDFIVILQVSDMTAYHKLAHALFTSQANIRNIRSFFSIHQAKFETRVPLPAPKI
ncbi:Lrp/AsnC family transcriptional regulator [Alcaligenes ammonioxydans]|jgi:Lrp/AsnC family leucine-responsive transcriptional regulator|uniref:Lrp/AsnC family transcriptional regulator n=1 Tax=Alcaligenes TaxID=507 RepID=UPI000269E0E8|nr:Lrp/AsnC family transcriptional regulator [Alcaligenes ammonioxydans]EJC61014.1 AsnC/Lrp family transcriptional regulator [Alcaligenes faecalis subsp. faecalis NCIB 8687]QBH19349.1 Lrp/AsnC family transcriptional regulator [Alcaligenes faecalis]MCH1879745.1 Lrp/AsnC family transcriptional regulator [Alcaligenes ammonioxydans]WGQ35388.1 Lrp/AsnC family transcriptional regulator [Alcaligenes faecalis]HRK85261.1 Lrp/AsnC family transcriptional regulator [Alcaligenes faecalis]